MLKIAGYIKNFHLGVQGLRAVHNKIARLTRLLIGGAILQSEARGGKQKFCQKWNLEVSQSLKSVVKALNFYSSTFKNKKCEELQIKITAQFQVSVLAFW